MEAREMHVAAISLSRTTAFWLWAITLLAVAILAFFSWRLWGIRQELGPASDSVDAAGSAPAAGQLVADADELPAYEDFDAWQVGQPVVLLREHLEIPMMVEPNPQARVMALVSTGREGSVAALGGRYGDHRWLLISYYLESLDMVVNSWVSSEFVRIDRAREGNQ